MKKTLTYLIIEMQKEKKNKEDKEYKFACTQNSVVKEH